MRKKTKQIATGGICAALTVVVCLLGALSVGGRILAPAVCGITLLLIKRYMSGKLAVTTYAASSLLLLMLPDRLTAAAYVLLLGYYPILSDSMGKLPLLLRLFLKTALVAAVGCACFFGGAALLGLWENPVFLKQYPLLIGLYCIMAVFYDLFLALLNRRLKTRWDEKLKKLFG
ncbi:MAG: hypothetical protein IJA75_04045 [Oscillospiraceae bacterium]|nr:hypothetical protein [Oscillospiraceae bacterium]